MFAHRRVVGPAISDLKAGIFRPPKRACGCSAPWQPDDTFCRKFVMAYITQPRNGQDRSPQNILWHAMIILPYISPVGAHSVRPRPCGEWCGETYGKQRTIQVSQRRDEASRPTDSKRAAGAFAACGPARGRTERPAGILLNINSGLRPPNRHFAAVYHHFTTVTFSVSCQQKS